MNKIIIHIIEFMVHPFALIIWLKFTEDRREN